MPAQWSEADLTRELTKFSEMKAELKELEESVKSHGERIRRHYEANEIKSFRVGNQDFTCAARAKKTYSRHCQREMDRLKKQIDAMKKLEEENFKDEDYDGPQQCQIEYITYHHMMVTEAKEES